MNLRFLKIAVLLITFGFITSCGDDEGPAEAPSVKFRASVGGAVFRSDTPTAILSNDGKLFVVTATNDLGSETFTLTVGSSNPDAPLVMEQSYNTASETLPASIQFETGGVTYKTNLETVGAINLNSFDLDLNFVFGSFTGDLENVAVPDELLFVTSGNMTGIEISVQ